MIRRRVKVQLVAFALVTVLSIVYAGNRFLEFGDVIDPPYEVGAQFTNGGGIFPRADVELLGTRVGKVKEIRVGPGRATTVMMAIDASVKIPNDVKAAVGSKSAIGEQYVELIPQSAGGRSLAPGTIIPLSRTTSPIVVTTLLKNVEGFVSSVDSDEMGTLLDELTAMFQGIGPTVGHLVEDADTLTRIEVNHVHQQTALIEDARSVLDTQVAKGKATKEYFHEWGGFVRTANKLSPTFVDVFKNGIVATGEVTQLLRDVEELVPLMLGNFLTLTELGRDHIDGLRKVLTLLPWVEEYAGQTIRYCDEVDPKTGEPIASTCHYDSQGHRIYAIYQTDQGLAGTPAACTQGYEGTTKYFPDGTPLNGGPREADDAPTNMDAKCTASPDSQTPNVRGAQNADR